MILLTGATGFIGSHLLKALLRHHRVRCLVRPGSAKKITIQSPNLHIVEGDLCSEKSVFDALVDIESVIHLAALLRHAEPQETLRFNVESTRVLTEKAIQRDIVRYVFVSTESVKRAELTDAYTQSKRKGEEIVKRHHNTVILRPSYVFGRGDHNGLGRLNNFLKRSWIIPVFGQLKAQIQPIYIDDLVNYILRAIEGSMTGTYLLAGSESTTMNEFLKQCSDHQGLKRVFLPIPKSILKIAANVGGRIFPGFGWGPAQFKNIYASNPKHSMDRTTSIFVYKPKGLEETLKAWLLEKQPS